MPRSAPMSTSERRDRRVGPGERDDGERRRAPGGDDRQGRFRDGVGEACRPDVERDRPETDGDGEGEGEIGQAEDDGLGDQLAEVAPDPGCRGDGHRAGDDERAQARGSRRSLPRRPLAGARLSRTPRSPPAVAAMTAIRGSGRASARPRAPSVPSVTAGTSRREPAASPTTASASPMAEPARRNSRRYADATRVVAADRRPIRSGRSRPRPRRPRRGRAGPRRPRSRGAPGSRTRCRRPRP